MPWEESHALDGPLKTIEFQQVAPEASSGLRKLLEGLISHLCGFERDCEMRPFAVHCTAQGQVLSQFGFVTNKRKAGAGGAGMLGCRGEEAHYEQSWLA